ncbi:hypothetical protein MF4836_08985 [Pseudomonas sp. MF4836]|nr:hypothetical protein MF4836_08985 [Pseudomonas sp. MF4836]
MNTLLEIMKIIINQSKFKEAHKAVARNKVLIKKVSGKAGIDTEKKIEIATFVLILTNEIQLHINSLIDKQSTNFTPEIKTEYSKLHHSSFFVKFLNNYDGAASAFDPLLEKLKSYTGEELTALILPVLEDVHAQWKKVADEADEYLNLTLNYVDKDEVDALKRMVESGIFYDMMNDTVGFRRLIFKPENFNSKNLTQNRDFYEILINRYEHCFDFLLDANTSNSNSRLKIIAKDDKYYVIGEDDNNKFIFEQLTKEYPISGYLFDFSDLQGDSDKADNLRMMIEMSLDVTSLKHMTASMTPSEAMIFSVELLKDYLNTDFYDLTIRASAEFNRWFLLELGNGRKFECSSMVEFSDSAKEHITKTVNSLYEIELETDKLYDLAKKLKERD